MRQGLKRVAHRRDDALTGVRWDRLEHLLAAYYREAGYQVEHVGTGASAGRFDGGVDLKLQRDGRVVLVQVKHWNAYKVPHNEVHQLIGLMVNARADAAILVTSGEFTKAAIEAATRNGLVQLIDGDELRAMLGPLPEAPPAARTADSLAAQVGEHLLHAAMDRALPAGRKAATSWAKATAATLALKGFALVVMLLIAYQVIQALGRNLDQSLQAVGRPATASIQRPAPAPQFVPSRPAVAPTPAVASFCIDQDPRTGASVDRCAEHAARPKPTLAEVRESQRKADAAMDVLRASTPEM
ncbi:restriction endonuclease [Luteimonas sp BLCC-B24]|uniref:restriction endonuclease n=1 Tax=Luteimonas sp. BLCC-B24 TaxID=3025317 RepID=UPI00234CBA16|nr:restriction endonuclease [Luteimonas sp. BLCC-B24]MDC7807996.1 restriction endonuclease [Luteimonas sp. BLCC-B24]